MSSEFQTGPHWLEIAFWASQICLTLIAAVAARFAYKQLLALKRNSDQELQIAHSNPILALDDRFSKELYEARSAFKKLQDEIRENVSKKYPRDGSIERDKKTREQWTIKLAEMRDTARDDYLTLMNLCGFFETVGMMVKHGYIDKTAILALFEGAIISVDNCFRDHINQRQNESGVPEGYHANALYIFDLCTKGPRS